MTDLGASRNFFERKLEERKIFAEKCKVRNEIYTSLESKRAALEDVLSDIKEYLTELELLKDAINREDVLFKTSRVEFLSKIITDRLGELFPQEGLSASITYNDSYRRTKAILRLVDSDGNTRKPKISEGKFLQYLIGFTAVEGIFRSMGRNIIYVDEAFSVASESNLTSVGEVIQKSVESGMQIVLVSQKPELYRNVPHREIRMHKDPIEKKVVIDDVIDV